MLGNIFIPEVVFYRTRFQSSDELIMTFFFLIVIPFVELVLFFGKKFENARALFIRLLYLPICFEATAFTIIEIICKNIL